MIIDRHFSIYKEMILLLALLSIVSCSNQENSQTVYADEINSGTEQMVDSLEDIYRTIDFTDHPYSNEEALKIMDQKIAQGEIKNSIQSYLDYGILLMKAGKNDKAISTFDKLFSLAPNLKDVNDTTAKLHRMRAIIYMRKGEVDNCVINHNAESCLFPIKGAAIHTEQRGSRGAIEIYKKILEKYPEDYESRWLLNVAYMTLGEYPDNVSEKYLISPSLIEDDISIPAFKNIAMDLGVDINEISGSSIIDDMDNDGDMDLLASSWALKGQLRYFENVNGDFQQKTEEAGLIGLVGGLNIKQTDYNNDGFLDVFVIRGAWRMNASTGIYPNSLLRNNGNGTFTDVTVESGVYNIGSSQSVVWIDLDNDGWLDLFVANESVPTQGAEKFPCKLYMNNGDGTFVDRANKFQLDFQGFFKGVTTADYDNDGDNDLYISNLAGDNLLIKNLLKENGNLSFKVVSIESNTRDPQQAFPCWFFDYDNDGWEDLYVSAYADFMDSRQTAAVAKSYLGLSSGSDSPRLYRNNGDGTFTNNTKAAGLDLALHTMGCNYGDINNDGNLDFYLGTGAPDYRTIVPNRLFINQDGKSFADVTTSANVGNIQKGHGISIADIDNDGDQDIYAVMGGAFSGDFFQNALFLNSGNDNNWVYIKLIGTQTNKAAIGSKIKLTITENGKRKYLYRTVSSGASFGANSLIQEIGLGKTLSIDKLEVQWANGSTQYVDYGSQSIKKRIVITEGKTEVQIEELRTLKLTGEAKQDHHKHH